jgi:hypothetical protein
MQQRARLRSQDRRQPAVLNNTQIGQNPQLSTFISVAQQQKNPAPTPTLPAHLLPHFLFTQNA